MRWSLCVLACWLGVASFAWADEPPAIPDRATLEKEFAANLTGVEMVGSWTITGRADGAKPREERYTISKVTKLDDKGTWLIQARIKYGDHDVNLPVPLQVEWAGDTPVLTLTKATLPGLGTFTARVLIYDDHYVGYWRHDDNRGQMWGRIERPKASDGAAPAAGAKPSESK